MWMMGCLRTIAHLKLQRSSRSWTKHLVSPRKQPEHFLGANNISIALARIKLSDEQMRKAVLDPVHNPLSPEQVSAILPALPTAEVLQRTLKGAKTDMCKARAALIEGALKKVNRGERRCETFLLDPTT